MIKQELLEKLKDYLTDADIERFQYLYQQIRTSGVPIRRKVVYFNEFNDLIKVVKRRASFK